MLKAQPSPSFVILGSLLPKQSHSSPGTSVSLLIVLGHSMGKAPVSKKAVNMQEDSLFAQEAAQCSYPPPTHLQKLLRTVTCAAL